MADDGDRVSEGTLAIPLLPAPPSRQPTLDELQREAVSALIGLPGGEAATSLANHAVEDGTLPESLVVAMLRHAAEVPSPGLLTDWLRVSARVLPRLERTPYPGDLERAITGVRTNATGPAEVIDDGALARAAAVVEFILRIEGEDVTAPLGTLMLGFFSRDGGPPRHGSGGVPWVRLYCAAFAELLGRRPDEVPRIAAYVLEHGPVRTDRDLLPVLAWLEEGIHPDLGDGWL